VWSVSVPKFTATQKHLWRISLCRSKDSTTSTWTWGPSSLGLTYLLTMAGRTTRWQEAVQLTAVSTAETARAFIGTWVAQFSNPSDLFSDGAHSLPLSPQLRQACPHGQKTIFYPPFSLAAFQEFLRKAGLISKTHLAVETLIFKYIVHIQGLYVALILHQIKKTRGIICIKPARCIQTSRRKRQLIIILFNQVK
jgi:hypothetical protein